ncbi:PilZ domain-containing protein [Sphingomonas sp. G124]|uniref:PilZ domain-containing protein n=1 Tax=Sphingomonas cremea TaxID=2904799 RepID=A0A9X1QP84_9SPHN|nr:PilZ domain-containing protein [Sphingomonas cremea]MCF2515757.1 PilZ domain-containing protein [Sphingomonas cremea]
MVDNSDSRRADRVPLRADIDFRRQGEHRWRVNILDFSPQGCRVEVPVRVVPGDTIWISLPGIESIQGTVCWVKEWEAGIEFANPLYPSVFEMVRERMRTAE